MAKLKFICILISFAFAFMLGSMAMKVMAQPYYDATFTSITVTNGTGSSDLLNGGTAKVYDGQTIWINDTCYNNNCGLFGAYFYAKLYINDVLAATTGETYDLKGNSFENQFNDYEYGAQNVNYRVELWWNSSTISSNTNYLEDSKTFSIQIVNLTVANWLTPQISIEKGKTTASTWSVGFTNGGNDMMFAASISVVDAGGLQISPSSTNLGNISSQGAESINFSVVAPNALSTGSTTVSFQVSYSDFEGNSHVESQSGSVLVTALGTNITSTLAPSNVNIGGSTTITATLLDGNGNPIANQSIDFQIYKATSWTSIGSASTDTSGIASLSYKPSSTGSFQVKAVFAGTANYASSTSLPTNLNVSMDYTLYSIVAAIIIVVALVAVGYVVFLRRGKEIPPPN